MRLLYGVLVILIFITIISIWGLKLMENYINDITILLIELEQELENNNTEKAKYIGNQIMQKWEKAAVLFPIMIDHSEIFDLDVTLTKIQHNLINERDFKNIVLEISAAKKMLEIVLEQEKLKLKNIF